MVVDLPLPVTLLPKLNHASGKIYPARFALMATPPLELEG